jgi:hypothetical protein
MRIYNRRRKSRCWCHFPSSALSTHWRPTRSRRSKLFAGLRAPTLDRIVRWRLLKNAIKLGGLKLAGAILELALEWQALWKNGPRQES